MQNTAEMRRSVMALTKVLRGYGLAIPYYILMVHMGERGYVRMSSIAELMGISTAAATMYADRLEDMGYAKRLRSRADRRAISLQLTERGEDLVDELEGKLSEELTERKGAWA